MRCQILSRSENIINWKTNINDLTKSMIKPVQPSTSISILQLSFLSQQLVGYLLWQSRHRQLGEHFIPALWHSQYFLRHWLFLHVHFLYGTQALTFLKEPGFRKLAICCASSIFFSLPVQFSQPEQMQSGPHISPFAKHSQQSFRQPIFEHLQPCRLWAPVSTEAYDSIVDESSVKPDGSMSSSNRSCFCAEASSHSTSTSFTSKSFFLKGNSFPPTDATLVILSSLWFIFQVLTH